MTGTSLGLNEFRLHSQTVGGKPRGKCDLCWTVTVPAARQVFIPKHDRSQYLGIDKNVIFNHHQVGTSEAIKLNSIWPMSCVKHNCCLMTLHV